MLQKASPVGTLPFLTSGPVEVVGVDPLDCVARSHRDPNVEVDHETGQFLAIDENHLCVDLTNIRSRIGRTRRSGDDGSDLVICLHHLEKAKGKTWPWSPQKYPAHSQEAKG